MRALILTLICFLTLWPVMPAQAQNADEKLVKIRLLPERAAIDSGDEIWIGIEQSITEHWHTYWKNPGDSGTEPSVIWDMPEGFEVSDIVWPAPHKLPYGPLLNYGYEDNVILLQKLKAPEDLPEGPINLKADIEILVCQEECIPEYGTYSLTLNGPNAALENNHAYLQSALDKVPQETDLPVFYSENDGNVILRISAYEEVLKDANLETTEFYPLEWGILNNAATPEIKIENDELVLMQARGERAMGAIQTLDGVLSVENIDGKRSTFAISAQKDGTSPARSTNATTETATDVTIIHALIFALLGGIILNLMPCVFPVLSIKALSLVKIAEKHPQLARMHGLSYTAGVVLSFLFIAGALIALQSGGAQIGWGFQLQNPWIVGALSYLLFVIGLNLMGFFELSNPLGNIGNKLTQNDGLTGSFFTGILATLVATPCTAPFMAGAIGFALVQPAIVSLIVFAALGLGLALPYLALSFAPSLQARLPKPGSWMDVFKQLLGFPMLIAALWLIWVLGQQTDITGLSGVLLGAILISFAIWLCSHKPKNKTRRHILLALAILSVFGAFALLPTQSTSTSNAPIKTSNTFSAPFSETALAQALSGDDPVFVEMTAAWCITCKVNHAVALNIDSTKALFKDHNVTFLVGDWTNEDPLITKYLQSYGRNGVPLYVYYGARNSKTGERPKPEVLPQVLTPAIVENVVKGKS